MMVPQWESCQMADWPMAAVVFFVVVFFKVIRLLSKIHLQITTLMHHTKFQLSQT